MKKIYLFCSAGMSTSLLAQRMQDCANEQGLEVEVKAYSHSNIQEIVESLHPDCILLGPQVKYLFEKTKEQFGNVAPVAVIDMASYGMMDGAKVLKTALGNIESFGK